MTDKTDVYWMKKALELAKKAMETDEVPVGALLVRDGETVGEGYNQPVSISDPTAHAEIVALRAASSRTGNYRLPGTTMYVTIEPCTMCVGALMHARVERVVYGASEPRAGALISNLGLHEKNHFNHRFQLTSGVLGDECGKLMKLFFECRR